MRDEARVAKAELRERMLEARRTLHPNERRQLDRRICSHVLRLLEERDCVDIAAFIAFRGEPDLQPALIALHEAGRRIWLPIVDGRHMRFGLWRPESRMRANRYGIPEPEPLRTCPAERLELVLTPLVAYSASGTRLGMGAGFYDRAFLFTRSAAAAGPWLVGVAYALQQVDSLPTAPWDVPLGAVVTDQGLQIFRE
ncbi:MAG: 5-formyltetrahydrofolate cyclo-ligase [Wenzhouxiangellaceae bacterium]|nr:5-formyltetrahydrofolate cyclo-ligase [Wenzhouxiangellaceae bacterium]